jgi:hypothetical protein
MQKGVALINSGIQKFSDDLDKIEIFQVRKEGGREGGRAGCLGL